LVLLVLFLNHTGMNKESLMETTKKKKSTIFIVIFAILGVILLLLLIWFAFLLISNNVQAKKDFDSRPLVLIHTPQNHDQVETGAAVLIHASARQQKGLRALELWVDDTLVAKHEVPEGKTTTSMTLSEDWIPNQAGDHLLIARATSINGVQGQATIVIGAEKRSEENQWMYQVEEGDSIESIAESFDMSPEELAELNPDLEGGDLSVGDELIIPEDELGDSPFPDEVEESEGGEEPPIEESGIEDAEDVDEEPPEPEDDSPGSLRLSDLFFELFEMIPRPSRPAEPVGLRMDVESLRSWGHEESLHCYVAFGVQSPQWVPDADGDPATDESFPALDLGWWDVQPYLAGDAAPVLYWPDNQDLTFTATCVGTAAGGTDALELGTIDLSIPPEDWDGSLKRIEVDGPEGHLYMQYRVSRQPTQLSAMPVILDPDMTPPINVRLDERRNSLRWDYNPQLDEEPISGFRVYLNGNLQWVEDASTYESGLPYEWFHPPCGSTYTFEVSAYRFELPDGLESSPGQVSITTPAEGCMREIQINFISLETFDLGGDGNSDDVSGDIGPPYGQFFANEWQIEFDARSPERGGSLDRPLGLSHNTVYDLRAIASDPAWRFNGLPYTIVEIPPGGSFEFGYQIMDQDDGRCRDADDSGCDDLICEGLSAIYHEGSSSDFDIYHEGTLTSENGRCKLTYSFGPAFGSPVGSGIPGWEPMPWISVQDVIIDPRNGNMQIPIINSGTATWPWHDLEVELQTREGESMGIYTWEEFVLEAGQRKVLEHPDIKLEPPYDACVLIDPNNLVREEFEAHDILQHVPVCPQLPDLMITDVVFRPDGGGRLSVVVQNRGDNPLENRELTLKAFLPDGSPAYLFGSWPDVNLEANETRRFELIGVNENARLRLQDGYSVTIDPNNTIPETNEDNNNFEVTSGNIKIWWCDSYIPHYYGLGSTSKMHLVVEILRDTQAEVVFEARRSNTLTSRETFSYGYNHCYLQGCNFTFSCTENSPTFKILGDEALRVSISAEFRAGSLGDFENLGTATQMFLSAQNWGALPMEGSFGWGFSNNRRLNVVPPIGMLAPPPWFSEFCIIEMP
jgi:hypothetical protein